MGAVYDDYFDPEEVIVEPGEKDRMSLVLSRYGCSHPETQKTSQTTRGLFARFE